jgi:CheY-like chemotaxis protein
MKASHQAIDTLECPSAPRGTVLLVDDDADFLAQQKLALENAGFTVLCAGSEEEARGVMDQHRPDVAVLDIMMEHMDSGFVLSHDLKKARPDMPVILVSSVMSETGLDFDTATAEERSWLKADAMLAKPVRCEQLTSEIDRLLPK